MVMADERWSGASCRDKGKRSVANERQRVAPSTLSQQKRRIYTGQAERRQTQSQWLVRHHNVRLQRYREWEEWHGGRWDATVPPFREGAGHHQTSPGLRRKRVFPWRVWFDFRAGQRPSAATNRGRGAHQSVWRFGRGGELQRRLQHWQRRQRPRRPLHVATQLKLGGNSSAPDRQHSRVIYCQKKNKKDLNMFLRQDGYHRTFRQLLHRA